LPVKSTLYGLDRAIPGNPVVIVEGVLDQWKLGNGSVATYGTAWTDDQVKLLRMLAPSKIYTFYDSESEAQKSAYQLAQHIWFTEVEMLSFDDKKDPGELTTTQAQNLMVDLLKG